ncbi:hypothetical protein C3L50_04475 [Flavobacterium alvei]|uniref:Uncharacterized protein n=1 Tax=Flavobacterium alvei TaxID=2080416 RepID=A0A2S5AEX6_9FLAO|nr:Imm74 family immunity protein [Flavobacterium alvei]POY40757.1 hypothetical protein C3L50_04475 [Flavobacterium alvei]
MKIEYKIISKGSLLIKYGNRKTIIHGELTFEPSVFYIDLNSFKNWDSPFENKKISENEKIEITQFLKKEENSTEFLFE